MARVICIMGESGAGKTTSLRNLDPKTTFIVDADRKGLSWRGWKKQYNNANKNYVQTSNVSAIEVIFKRMDTDFKNVKVLVIDGLSTIMVDDEMKRMKEKGYDRWISLAQCVWELVSNAHLLRDNLNIVFIGHVQTDRDETGYEFTRLKTSGKKLDKITLESKFTTVLWARCLDGQYVFETEANKSTAKSPMGCFEKRIPNDISFVIKQLTAYEEGE